MKRNHLHAFFFWGWCVVVIASYIVLHSAAGLTLPHPWTDESAFLWQAIAFQRHGWLFAPELNPLRDIMQMPPGYMVFMGIVFRVIGASLVAARTVSLIAMIGAFTLLSCALRPLRASFVPLATLGAIFMMVPVVTVGNAARMDSMVLLMGAASVFFFQRGKPFAALMSVAVAPLFHPNGFYFWAAAAVIIVVMHKQHTWPSKRVVIAAAVCVLVAWAWYGIYIVEHWPAFVADMTFQFKLKSSRSSHLFEISNVILYVVVLASAAYGYRAFRTSPLFAVYGVVLWVLYLVGWEMWYESYRGVALVLMLTSVICVVVETAQSRSSKYLNKRMVYTGAALVIAVSAVAVYQSVDFTKSFTRLWTGPWKWMRYADAGVPYLKESDKQSVRDYLSELNQRNRTTLVRFNPPADALFFTEYETDRVKFCQPTFISVDPDVYIAHSSRYLGVWFSQEAQHLEMFMQSTEKRILMARDSTELILCGPVVTSHYDNLRH